MTSDDELAERGRAIFERLRGDTTSEAPSEEAPAEQVAGGEPPQEQAEQAASEVPEAEQPHDDGFSGAPGQGEEPGHQGGQPGDAEAPVPRAEESGDEGGAPVAQAEETGQYGAQAPTTPEADDALVSAAVGEAEEPPEPEPAAAAAVGEADLDEAGEVHEAVGGDETDAPGVVDAEVAVHEGEHAEAGAAAPAPTDSGAHDEPNSPTIELPGAEEIVASLDDPPATAPNPFSRPLPRVLAIANQKGGVGKTTTAVNLGAALAELGYRVLVIDLDPQGNATTGLGVNPRNLETSVYDVIMHDTPLEDCIEPTSLRNLFVVPATIDLAGAEIELVPAFSRELKLKKALEPVLEDFDFALIDCPPSLGLITVNGLAAATEVVVPIQCEYYALEGLGQLLRNVNLVQGNLNPRLEVSAIILTMYDARTKLADQVAGEVRAHFGTKVCRNIVPRTVRLSEAPSFGQPIIVFDPSSRGAIAYRELAKEVSGGAPQRVG